MIEYNIRTDHIRGTSLMKKNDGDGDKICANCEHGVVIFTGDEVLCKKHGLVHATACCRKYRSDMLKRTVKPLPALPSLIPVSPADD